MTNYYTAHIQNHIQDELFAASKSIKIAMAWFTNNRLFQIVLLKLQTGVDVEIIINDDEINKGDNKLDFDAFVKHGGKLHWVNDGQLMHLKQCIIDEYVLLTGSYNWTYKAEEQLAENLLVIKDEKTAVDKALKAHNKLAAEYDRVIIDTEESKETEDIHETTSQSESNDVQSSHNEPIAVVTQVEDPKEILAKAVEQFRNKINKLLSEYSLEQENADNYCRINRVVRDIAESLDENKKYNEPETFLSLLKEGFQNHKVAPSIAELQWEKYMKEGNLGKVYVTKIFHDYIRHPHHGARVASHFYPENNEHLYQQISVHHIGFSLRVQNTKSKKFNFKRLDYAQNPELQIKDQEPIPVIVCEDEDGQEFCLSAENLTAKMQRPKNWFYIEKIDNEHFYEYWLTHENKMVPKKYDFALPKTYTSYHDLGQKLDDLSDFYYRAGRRMGLKEFYFDFDWSLLVDAAVQDYKKQEPLEVQKRLLVDAVVQNDKKQEPLETQKRLEAVYIKGASVNYDFLREDDEVKLQLRDPFFLECDQLRMEYTDDSNFLSAIYQKYKDKEMCLSTKLLHQRYRYYNGRLDFPDTSFHFPRFNTPERQVYYYGISVVK